MDLRTTREKLLQAIADYYMETHGDNFEAELMLLKVMCYEMEEDYKRLNKEIFNYALEELENGNPEPVSKMYEVLGRSGLAYLCVEREEVEKFMRVTGKSRIKLNSKTAFLFKKLFFILGSIYVCECENNPLVVKEAVNNVAKVLTQNPDFVREETPFHESYVQHVSPILVDMPLVEKENDVYKIDFRLLTNTYFAVAAQVFFEAKMCEGYEPVVLRDRVRKFAELRKKTILSAIERKRINMLFPKIVKYMKVFDEEMGRTLETMITEEV